MLHLAQHSRTEAGRDEETQENAYNLLINAYTLKRK